MKTPQENLLMAKTIAQEVRAAGGCAYFVGGFVRDRVLGRPVEDIDIEVHGVSPETLASLLDRLGERLNIGASFGIFGLRGYDLDIAMPRKEEANGRGHRDFSIYVDPALGTYRAAERRDFTVNSMMQNILTGEIIDHFGGRADLDARVLRHVSDRTFAEDPLRVLRGAQFAARFGFSVAQETLALSAHVDLSTLARERVEAELRKALLFADRPSVFFETLRLCGQLSVWFPEVEELSAIEQDPLFHGEGDVFVHTMLVLDEAAKLRARAVHPRGLMYAAITHDFGKTLTTVRDRDRVHTFGHETAGLPLAERWMRRLTDEADLIAYVLNMTELHMRPNMLCAMHSSYKASNRLFDLSVCPEDLLLLAIADGLGCRGAEPYRDVTDELYDRLAFFQRTMDAPFVQGRDLLAAGLLPDRDFSDFLAYAHKLRVAGVPKDSALKQTLAYARRRRGSDSDPVT